METPKILGSVGLNVEELGRNVDEAKAKIKELSAEAKALGELFNKLGVQTNLGEVTAELQNMGDSLTEITKETAGNYEKLNNTIRTGQKKVVETIKQRQKMGFISPEQSNEFLDAYELTNSYKIEKNLETIAKLKEKLGTKQEAYKLAKGTDEEEFIRKQMETTQKQLNKLVNTNRTYISEIKKTQQAREEIRQKLEKSENALNKLNTKQTTFSAKSEEKEIDKRNKIRLSKENMYRKLFVNIDQAESKQRLKIEKDRLDKTNMYTKLFIQIEQNDMKQAVAEEKRTNAQRLRDVIERKKKEIMYTQMFAKIERQESQKSIQEAKKQKKEMDKILGTQYSGSARDRWRSLSNYAFDATLLYGGMQGVTAIADNIKSIEKQSVELGRIMNNASKFDIDELRDNAFEVGMLTAQQVGDVQKIQNLWARTSDDIANNADAMKKLTEVTAIGMNVGGFTDAEEAVQLLNATLSQMNLEWTQATSVMDSWIKIADTSAVGTAKDLADATMKVGSQAKLMGLGIHDINAITAVLSNNMAKSGEDIGTAMKTIFSYFQDEGTIKILDKYGVAVKKNATEYNNFAYIMEQLHTTYKKLEQDNNQTGIHEISNALGRIRRVDYVGTLMSHWNEYPELLQASLESTGYAVDQNEKVMNTYEAQVGQLKVAFQQLSWSIGESGLLEDMKALVKMAVGAVDWFNKLDKGTKTFILRIIEMSALFAMLNKMSDLFSGQSIVASLIKLGALISGNTTALKANSVAEVQNQVVKTASATVTIKSAVATKTATTAMIGYKTAIWGVLIAIPLLIGYLQGLKAHMQDFKNRQDEATDGIKEFEKMMNKKYLTESDIPNYEDRLESLKEAQIKLKELQDKAKASQSNQYDYGGGILGTGGHTDFLQAEDDLRNYELELGKLGTTSKDIQKDIDDLNGKIVQNKDINFVTAMKSIETIEGMQKHNKAVKDSIGEYKRLHAEVLKTGAKSEEYNKVVKFLTDNFKKMKPIIDGKTGAVTLDTEAMEASTIVMGKLTEAQMNELNMYSQLDEASRTIAINRVTDEINATNAVITGVEGRIKAQEAEIDGMVALNNLYFFRNELLAKQNEKLDYAKFKLEALKAIKPYSSSNFGTGEGEDGDEDYKAKYDEYYKFINDRAKIENDLNFNQAKASATQQSKLGLLNEEIDLYKQQQKLLADINIQQRKERDELKAKIKGYGFDFDGDTITNYAKLSELSGDTAKEAEEFIERYIELVNSKIPELSAQWWTLQSNIFETENEKLEIVQEAEEKIKEMIRQTYQTEKDELDKSLKNYEDTVNNKIKALDRQYSEENYNDDMKKEQEKLGDIQEQINKLRLDDSKEAKAKLAELEQEKSDQLESINDMQRDKEHEDRKQSLQDKIDDYRKDVEQQKLALDEQYSNEKLNLMARQAIYDGYYKDIKGNIISVKEEYILFENRFGAGLTTLGETIKNNFTTKLEDAMNILKSFNTLANNSPYLTGLNLNNTASSLTSSVPYNVITPTYAGTSGGSSVEFKIDNLVTITGNVDKDLIPVIKQTVQDSLTKIITDAKKTGVIMPL